MAYYVLCLAIVCAYLGKKYWDSESKYASIGFSFYTAASIFLGSLSILDIFYI